MESKQRTVYALTFAALCCVLFATTPLRAEDKLAPYIAMLDSPQEEVLIAAARNIAGFRNKAEKAVLPMTKLLENDRVPVRLAALNAYAEIGIYAKRAIPAMEKQLTHTNPYVRYYAAVALDSTGSPEAKALAKPILAAGSPAALLAGITEKPESKSEEEYGPPLPPEAIKPPASPEPPASPTPPAKAAPLPPAVPIVP